MSGAACGAGGKVAIVDVDRPTAQHGTPQAPSCCARSAAVGFRRIGDLDLGAAGGYLAVFEPVGQAARTGCDQAMPAPLRTCRKIAVTAA